MDRKNLWRVQKKTMVCAGYGKARNISGCYGDGGGPLSCEENGRYVVIAGGGEGRGVGGRGGIREGLYPYIQVTVECVRTRKLARQNGTRQSASTESS